MAELGINPQLGCVDQEKGCMFTRPLAAKFFLNESRKVFGEEFGSEVVNPCAHACMGARILVGEVATIEIGGVNYGINPTN